MSKSTDNLKIMKRINLLLVALLVSISFYGQTWDNSKPDNRLTIGIRAGSNMSSISVDDNDSSIKSKWGFHIGLNVDVNIVKSFAVETGLFYSAKGFKLDKQMGYDKSNNYDLNYIQLPLLAVFRLNVSENANIQLKAGGYAGYLINEPETLRVKKPDVGLIVGAGISYRKFYLGLQYELGMYNALKVGYGDACKNRNLAISVGYDF